MSSLSDLHSKYVRQRAALVSLYDMIKSKGIYTDYERQNALRIISIAADMPLVEPDHNKDSDSEDLVDDFML